MSGFRVETIERIDDIRAEDWDSVVSGREPLLSHQFLRVCERANIEHTVYRYVVIRDAQGIAAVTTFSRMDAPLDVLAGPRIRNAASTVRESFPRFLRQPVLLCGMPVSLGQAPIGFRRDVDQAELMPVVAEAMVRVGAELESKLFVFKEFNADRSSCFAELETHGFFHAPSLRYHVLPIRWDSFQEYLAALRSGYRRQILRDRCLAERRGFRTRVDVDFADSVDRFHAMYRDVMAHTVNALEVLPRAFFANLAESFANDLVMLRVDHRCELVGGALLLRSGDHLHFLLVGIDAVHNQRFHFYPYLMAHIVEYAIESGAKRLFMGQTSDSVKSRFGTTVEPRSLYLKHANPLVHGMLRSAAKALFRENPGMPRRVFNTVAADHVPA